MTISQPLAELEQRDAFIARHIGPNATEIAAMLAAIGASSLDQLIDETVPASIRLPQALDLPSPRTEHEALASLKQIAGKNRIAKSLIGMGYADTNTPNVILRNVLENPGWYTAYTPYQAEIAQGRLEALLNYQQMVMDLTGLEMANASLLDEATAAAEAMTMARRISRSKSNAFSRPALASLVTNWFSASRTRPPTRMCSARCSNTRTTMAKSPIFPHPSPHSNRAVPSSPSPAT
jgi:glycine dehydrogenase